MTLLLPFALMLMQVGIDPNGGQVPGIPEELRNRPPRGATPEARTPAPAPPPAKLTACLDAIQTSPANAAERASGWLASAQGLERAQAGHCLGVAQAESGNWSASAASFASARDSVPAANTSYRARLGALAGNAALAAGDAAKALALLDAARGEAAESGGMAAEIALDRARALVALNRPAEAMLALGEARAANPGDAQAWLLSAALSRRQGDLVSAQAQIEKAATLAPRDPAVGLEAGVIAALAGNDGAARQSFESVIALAPESEQAAAAKSYLEQLQP
ncbi:MAG TPA: tetratricopeptide repeat protein [Qipengyuania sp.]|nr:tetratricopeptide repeat protein [Qipengyuania sp.]